MNLLRLAWKSLLNRRSTALLTMLTVAVSELATQGVLFGGGALELTNARDLILGR